MDHAWERFRTMLDVQSLNSPPSKYLLENVYFSFQDDVIALKTAHLMNPNRLLWAGDLPHNDSTWPESTSLLERHTQDVPDESVRRIIHDNVVEFYSLKLAS
jgi:predicted TIM-barrel fold metal-dependent hydrolase